MSEKAKTIREEERAAAMQLIDKIARANGLFVLLNCEVRELNDPEIAKLALMPYMSFGKLRPPLVSLN